MKITQDHIEQYKSYMNRKEYSDNTKKQYLMYAKDWKDKKFNQENVNKELEKAPNNYRAFLQTFKAALNKKDIEITYPQRQSKKKTTIHYFTEDEVKQIIKQTNHTKLEIIFRLMVESGLRISEVLNLQKKDIDTINQTVRGTGKGNKEFKQPIKDYTNELIKSYIANYDRDEHPFRWEGVGYQRQKAWYETKKTVSNILPYKKEDEIYPHVFRHTCGTLLLKNGMNMREVQKFLRHKNLSTTEAYTEVNREQLISKWDDII